MRTILGFLLISVAALSPACDADKDRVIEDGFRHQPTFQNLTEREHVLNNLELSYNERRINEFGKLLDNNFTFFFSPADVGGNIPAQWGRANEMEAAARLFANPAPAPYPTCRSIRMDLKFEGGVAWRDTIPPAFPAETWYTGTVYYEFTFEMVPDFTLIAVPGSQAQFTVRNGGTDDAPQWRLVEWQDLATNSAVLQSAVSTETTTWGGVKALYR